MQFFLDTRNIIKQRMVLYEVFRQNEAKKIPTEILNNTPILYPYFSHSRIFLEHKTVTPRKYLDTVRLKVFGGKMFYPPPPPPIMHKQFRNPKISEREKGSPTIFFGSVKLKTIDIKLRYPPFYP